MGSRQTAINTQQIIKELARKMGYKSEVINIPKTHREKAKKTLAGIVAYRKLPDFYYWYVCKILEIPNDNDTTIRH